MLEPTLFAIYSVLLGGGCFYIGHRGLSGVKNDLSDIKTDVSTIKAKVDGTPPATP